MDGCRHREGGSEEAGAALDHCASLGNEVFADLLQEECVLVDIMAASHRPSRFFKPNVYFSCMSLPLAPQSRTDGDTVAQALRALQACGAHGWPGGQRNGRLFSAGTARLPAGPR